MTASSLTAAALPALHGSGVHLADREHPIRRIGLLFPGHGSQYLDMLSGLSTDRAVAEILGQADAEYAELTGGPLTRLLWSQHGAVQADLFDPEVMQPAIYVASVAIGAVLARAGVEPVVVLGHSLGEFAALTFAGALDLHNGMRAVHARALSVKGLPRREWGAMYAVVVPDRAARGVLHRALALSSRRTGESVTIGIENAVDLLVISGGEQATALVAQSVTAAGLTCTRLPVTHGFHSAVLEDAVEPLRAALETVRFSVPRVPVLSTAVADYYTEADLPQLPVLLSRQLITPFSFRDLLSEAAASGVEGYLEVGPKAVLCGLLERNQPGAVGIPTLIPGAEQAALDSAQAFLTAEGLIDGAGQARLDSAVRILGYLTGYPSALIDVDAPLMAGLGIPATVRAELEQRLQVSRVSQGMDLSLRELLTEDRRSVSPAEPRRSEIDLRVLESVGIRVNPSPVVAPVRKGSTPLDRAELVEVITAALAERSGYPTELIEPQLDLEADLGIDSVKRAEVISEMANRFGLVLQAADFSQVSSVDAIADLAQRMLRLTTSESAPEDDVSEYLQLPEQPIGQRYLPVAVERPLDPTDRPVFSLSGRDVVVVLDPRQPAARAVLELVRAQAARTLTLVPRGAAALMDIDVVEIDWARVELAAEQVNQARNEFGPVQVVVNLLGLAEDDGDPFTQDATAFSAEVDQHFGSHFLVTRAWYTDLAEAADLRGYLTLSSIGGVFGIQHAPTGNPLGGIGGGFAKSLAKELPHLHTKVIDVDRAGLGRIVELVSRELVVDEPSDDLEIGYVAGRRFVVKVLPQSTAEVPSASWQPPRGTTAIVSGGARGITLECVEVLARMPGLTVVVLGRTDPLPPDSPWAQLTDAEWAHARTDFMRRQAAEQPGRAPMSVMQDYQRTGHARQLRQTLQRLEQMPGTVVYRNCDVRDSVAVGELVHSVAAEYGPVSLVVHGAGLESLGTVPKKPLAHSFDVVAVKALGLHNLWHAVEDQPVERFLSFGSVSGRFGMDGQVDYTAASQLLSVLSSKLSAAGTPSRRVSTLEWTAWADTGMADHPTVRAVQERDRGLQYLPLAEGVRHFARELMSGMEVPQPLVFGPLGSNEPRGQLNVLDEQRRSVRYLVDPKTQRVQDLPRLSLLDHVEVATSSEKVSATVILDHSTDTYLGDHLIRGHATFPGVLHIESQAQTASMLAPQARLIEVQDIALTRFLTVRPGDAVSCVIEATREPAEHGMVVVTSLTSEFTTPSGVVLDPHRQHSTGRFIFSADAPETIAAQDLRPEYATGREYDVDAYYSCAAPAITFGSTLRHLEGAVQTGPDRVLLKLRQPVRPDLVRTLIAPQFLTAPIVIDNAGRGGLLWALDRHGQHVVPQSIRRGRILRVPAPGELLLASVDIDWHAMCLVNITVVSHASGEVLLSLDEIGLVTIAADAGAVGTLLR